MVPSAELLFQLAYIIYLYPVKIWQKNLCTMQIH